MREGTRRKKTHRACRASGSGRKSCLRRVLRIHHSDHPVDAHSRPASSLKMLYSHPAVLLPPPCIPDGLRLLMSVITV